MSQIDEASEADDLVLASGEADAAYVAKGQGGASDALLVPGASSYGLWDPIPIRVNQAFNIQGSLNAIIDCPKCVENGLNVSCVGSKQLNEHILNAYPTILVNWMCERCDKTYPTIHSWRCHYPKCRGSVLNQAAEFKCSDCPMAFSTKIGLGQHERHAYPKTRNAKRAALLEKPSEKGGRKLTVWTAEEIELLGQLNAEFSGERNINIKLMKSFPGKTNRQISYARRRLKPLGNPATRVEINSANLAEDVVLEEVSDAEIVPNIQEATAVSTPPVEDNNWRDKIASEVRLLCDIPDKWAVLFNRLVEISYSETTSHNEINLICDSIAGELTKTQKPASDGISNGSKSRKGGYANCQELMNNCPKKLADAVAANDFSLLQMRQAPDTNDTRELYVNIWGTPGPKQEATDQEVIAIETKDIFRPITPAEVEQKVKRIANSSAAGPDGVRKSHLRGKGVSIILAKLFNLLLLTEVYPAAWKQNRTTLIPKAGKDPCDVKNWRPITISSMLGRIFSALIDHRIREVIQHNERQKGFTQENGCFNNTRLLSAAIKEAKASGGIFTVLDISKAFDTIPHQAIRLGLERKGISLVVVNYILNMYSGCKTTIKTRDGEVPIELKRGVKQGDPLSPLLFNLVIEPIIELIQNNSSEITVEEENLAAMAFADDMILLARDRKTAIDQINSVYTELRKRGMKLSVEKCFAFQYVSKAKTWYIKDPEMVVNGIPILYGEPDKAFRYLGAAATPWKGLVEGIELDVIKEIIDRVKVLPIKPMQKVSLLRTYLLPRYTYVLVMCPPSKETLKSIDSAIRGGVKHILHLHESTNNAFLYTPRKEGGLGLLEVLPMVYLAALRNAAKASQSDDILVRKTINNEASHNQYKAFAAALRLPWPATMEQLANRKKQIKLGYRNEWAQLIAQGQGVDDFAQEPLSNAWLSRNDLLRSSRIIDAINCALIRSRPERL